MLKIFSQTTPQSDYCQGLSVNADLFWNQGKDMTFLTTAGKDILVGTLNEAALAGHMKIVDTRLTTYGTNPQFGFSYLVVLGQSHIMIHTWPEKFFMNVDIFTCGSEGDPVLIFQFLQQKFKPDHVQKNQLQRGIRKDISSTNERPDTPAQIRSPDTPPDQPNDSQQSP